MPPPKSLRISTSTPVSPKLRVLQNPVFSRPARFTQWLDQNVLTKELIGRGKISEAYVLALKDGSRFILRETYMAEEPTRIAILHEFDVYERLLKQRRYDNYVSKLLYAQCPMTYDMRPYSKQNYAYFLFEYKDGQPLDRFIADAQRSGTYIPAKIVLKWIQHLLEGAELLGSTGIVHRDIKPSNLFVDVGGDRILMFDFEISCFSGSSDNSGNSNSGSSNDQGRGCLVYEFHGTRPYARTKALDVLVHNKNTFHDPYEYTTLDDVHAIRVVALSDLVKVVHPTERTAYLQTVGSIIRSS